MFMRLLIWWGQKGAPGFLGLSSRAFLFPPAIPSFSKLRATKLVMPSVYKGPVGLGQVVDQMFCIPMTKLSSENAPPPQSRQIEVGQAVAGIP